jgi:hypothetical protein
MKVTDLHLSWRVSSQFSQADLGREVHMQQTTKFEIHSRLHQNLNVPEHSGTLSRCATKPWRV